MGDADYLRHLLKTKGGKKAVVIPGEESILSTVCKHGHVEMLKYLQEEKVVDPKQVDSFSAGDNRLNCLHIAVQKNKPEMVDHLLR